MTNLYRCSKCGNNIPSETDDGLICHTCDNNTFTQVTEENSNKIPFPTHLYSYGDRDESVCNDSSGFCPCGEFITHPKNEPCSIDKVEKQPKTWDCHCRTSSCPCGAYVAHKVDEPCTAKNAGE
jgi:hypothetical protein